MAKRGSSQPRVGKLKGASPGKTQPKAGTVGGHVRRVAAQPRLGNRSRSGR